MRYFDLTGKTAVITGGNRGIGLAVAKGMAEAGATVVIINRTVESGLKAAEIINTHCEDVTCGKAYSLCADINNSPVIRKLMLEVAERHGGLDILVNCAGVLVRKPASEVTEEDWDHMCDANMKALFFTCQAAANVMQRQCGGKIINIASVLAIIAQQGLAVYAATKAGVAHLTKALAVEWIQNKVYINAIAPTLTITDINRPYFEANPDVLKGFMDATPIGRPSLPEDYVGPALFLASAASDYMIGQTLIVDGGRSGL